MLLPEPTYQGPENIVYFRANGLEDELQRDPHVTWIVAFFAPWWFHVVINDTLKIQIVKKWQGVKSTFIAKKLLSFRPKTNKNYYYCDFSLFYRSPSCINFTPIFSKLSAKYHLPNLKFGKCFFYFP